MQRALSMIRTQFDRAGIALSGLCIVHCMASLALVWVFGAGGTMLTNPAIHEIGLGMAIIVAAAAIGFGAVRHRRLLPFLVAVVGLCIMAYALTIPHGLVEAALTVVGVIFVSLGHLMNLRAAR